jgi:NitT/TauT family transport system permease protein
MGILLSSLLFVLSITVYIFISEARHAENPKDKLMPTIYKVVDGFERTAFEKDRKGEYRLLVDTIASVRRFAISLIILSIFGVLLGLHMGVFPYWEKLFYRFVLFFDKTPAVALLPILFIVFGLGEVAKIALIVIGVMPTIVLDTYLRAKTVPREQIVKSLTLTASHFEIMYRVVLAQIFPKVLDTIRLNFKAIVLFLIVGEALAAKAGLGYRIFVVRRYVAMDIIIPYVIWISLLAFLADLVVRLWIKWRYPWVDKS